MTIGKNMKAIAAAVGALVALIVGVIAGAPEGTPALGLVMSNVGAIVTQMAVIAGAVWFSPANA